MVAVNVAVFPEHIVAFATEIVSTLITAWFVSPAPPFVAPLGGNSDS